MTGKRLIALLAAFALLSSAAGCSRRGEEEMTPGDGTQTVTPPEDTGSQSGQDDGQDAEQGGRPDTGADGGTGGEPDGEGPDSADPDGGDPDGGEGDGPEDGGQEALSVLCAPPGPVAEALTVAVPSGWTLETAEDAVSRLESGEARAAAIPLGEAARLYNATDGRVRVLALLSLGGWVVAERGDGIGSVFSLAGRTVAVPENAPEAAAVFEYIMREYGFEPGDTVLIEKSADAGSEDIALLPSDLPENGGQRAAIDLLEEWENVTGSRMWPGMCLAVRADAEDADALASAARSAVEGAESGCTGLEFRWVSGAEELRETLEEYLTLLYELDPSLIGGFIPDDGFYM